MFPALLPWRRGWLSQAPGRKREPSAFIPTPDVSAEADAARSRPLLPSTGGRTPRRTFRGTTLLWSRIIPPLMRPLPRLLPLRSVIPCLSPNASERSVGVSLLTSPRWACTGLRTAPHRDRGRAVVACARFFCAFTISVRYSNGTRPSGWRLLRGRLGNRTPPPPFRGDVGSLDTTDLAALELGEVSRGEV